MFSSTYDAITTTSLIIRLVFAVAGMFLWGFVSRHIVRSKGYPDSENHGFAWGFWLGWIGLIVCVCKKPYGNPMDRFNQFGQPGQFGQFNQYGQGGFNNFNQPGGFNQPNNNMYGGQYQQPQQPTYQQPQQPTYQQPTYQQPTYQQPQPYQPDFSQPQYGQPDNYYQQTPDTNKQYDSGAEMDGIDTSKLTNLDDMFK